MTASKEHGRRKAVGERPAHGLTVGWQRACGRGMYCDVVLRVLVQKLEGRCGHAGIEATNRAQVWALAAVRAR
jgi:hypothetical protein